MMQSQIDSLRGKIGYNELVDTTSVQKLTNKGLVTPKINGDARLTATATELNTLDGITSNVAELNALDGKMGAWTSFVPAWTNLTVGAGTNTGFYCQIGKLVFFRVCFIFGSGSSVGTSPTLTLPVSISSYSGITNISQDVYLVDNSVGVLLGTMRQTGIIYFDYTSGTVTSQAVITATAPFTWTTSDAITMSGFYEAS